MHVTLRWVIVVRIVVRIVARIVVMDAIMSVCVTMLKLPQTPNNLRISCNR